MSNTPKKPLKKPVEWEPVAGLRILDPDGWDRLNLEESWNTKITYDDFMYRAMHSTVQMIPREDA